MNNRDSTVRWTSSKRLGLALGCVLALVLGLVAFNAQERPVVTVPFAVIPSTKAGDAPTLTDGQKLQVTSYLKDLKILQLQFEVVKGQLNAFVQPLQKDGYELVLEPCCTYVKKTK